MKPIYYINLNRAPERRSHMELLGQKAGLTMKRVDAVDGLALSDVSFDSVHPKKANARRMTKGEVACFLSHRKAWSLIAESDQTHGVILEDDIYFSTTLGQLLTQTDWLHASMDLVKLDKGTDKKVCLGSNIVSANGIEFRRLLSMHLRAGAYIVSRAFATRLVEETQTFDVPVDDFLFSPGHGILETSAIWQSNPCVCTHPQHIELDFLPERASTSFLDEDRMKNRRAFSREKPLLARVWREIKRPVRDLKSFIKRNLLVRGDQSTWETLDFKE